MGCWVARLPGASPVNGIAALGGATQQPSNSATQQPCFCNRSPETCVYIPRMTAILSETIDFPTALKRAQDGDHDAFAELIEQHEAMVYSLGHHFFSDRGRAEEIAQDVFLQLYRNRATIESDSHLLFWLRQVTTRRCIDQTRRFRMKAVSLEDAGELRAADRHIDPLRDRRL